MVMEGGGASPGHLVSLLYGLFALVWLLECWGACWSWPSSHFGRFMMANFRHPLTRWYLAYEDLSDRGATRTLAREANAGDVG